MLLTVPPSFPLYADVLSFSESPHSSLLPSPQLLYQNQLDAPTSRPIQRVNHQVRLSFSIALFDSLNIDLLKAFNNFDGDIEFNEVNEELSSKVAVIEAFLRIDLFLYFDFESSSDFIFEFDSTSSSETNSQPSFDDFDSHNENNEDEMTLQHTHSNFCINNNFRISSCNTSYTGEKLIKILAGDVLIPK